MQSQEPHIPSQYQGLPPEPATPPPPTPRRSYTWILLTVIALQLGFIIYQQIDKNKRTQQAKVLVAERNDAVQTRDEVQQDYDAALARLDDLVSKNSALNTEIENKNGEVASLRSQIDQILSDKRATAADLAKARTLIQKLNSKVRRYEDRIAELEGANRKLSAVNATLTGERDSVVSDNAALRQLGSVLHASNIRMLPIDLRRGGQKEVTTTKAKKVDVLRIYLDIDENRIAESGTKELLIRIIGPDGNLLSNAAYGSGVTTTAAGENLGYTLSKQVLITRGTDLRDVTVDWTQDSDYRRGNYAIEVYHDGYQIGQGTVTLK